MEGRRESPGRRDKHCVREGLHVALGISGVRDKSTYRPGEPGPGEPGRMWKLWVELRC